ncbi:MAG: PKD domain-containing protein, partial [Cyclobacteriaceae bacterium]
LPTGSLCTQTPISFTNTSNYDQGSPVMFSWDFDGDGRTDSNEATPSYTYPTSDNYDVRLIVSLPQGCADTLVQSIFLNEGYAVDFAWDNLCFGEEIVFENLSLDDAGYSYSWDFGDDGGTSTDRDPTYAYSTAGSYTVTLVVDNGTCAIPFSRGVVVNGDPLVSADIDEGIQNVPIGFMGIDQTLQGDSIVSWTWDFGGQGMSADRDATFIFDTEGSYTIELTIETAQGCTDNYSEVIAVEAPQTAYPFFTAYSPICKGERVVFENTAVNASSYVWGFCHDSFERLAEVESVSILPSASFANSITMVSSEG